MKAREAIICWTPYRFDHRSTVGQCKVVSINSDTSSVKNYMMKVGAMFADWLEMDDETRQLRMMMDFHTAIVRDGIDPQVAHSAFLAIDEYRELIAPDIKGAAA